MRLMTLPIKAYDRATADLKGEDNIGQEDLYETEMTIDAESISYAHPTMVDGIMACAIAHFPDEVTTIYMTYKEFVKKWKQRLREPPDDEIMAGMQCSGKTIGEPVLPQTNIGETEPCPICGAKIVCQDGVNTCQDCGAKFE